MIADLPTSLVSYAVVDANGASSWHYHKHLFNLFFVTEGTVQLWVGEPDSATVIDLAAQDCHVIPPGTVHKFVAGPSGAEFVEVYWAVPASFHDIERLRLDETRPTSC